MAVPQILIAFYYSLILNLSDIVFNHMLLSSGIGDSVGLFIKFFYKPPKSLYCVLVLREQNGVNCASSTNNVACFSFPFVLCWLSYIYLLCIDVPVGVSQKFMTILDSRDLKTLGQISYKNWLNVWLLSSC